MLSNSSSESVQSLLGILDGPDRHVFVSDFSGDETVSTRPV
jgi:hypothetical protein